MSESTVALEVAALRAAQPAWEQLGAEGRVEWLGRYRDWLLDNSGRLSALVCEDSHKPKAEAPLEVNLAIDQINYYSKRATGYLAPERPRAHNLLTATKRLDLAHRPYPVVGVISAWNFPLGLSLFDAVPALLAGAAVIIKPSEYTPLAVAAAVHGWAAIGAPPVFTVVSGAGDVGAELVDHVDFVQFTGSVRTGTAVAQRAAGRLIPFGLELGGKDPALVLADADLDVAAAGIAFGGLSNSGQMCTSIERIYVEDSIHDAFVEKLVAKVASLRQNTGSGYDTDLGAMAVDAQVATVQAHVDDAIAKGAVVRIGGKRLQGSFFAPTVLTQVDHSMAVMREETFGPVLPVMRVADVDEAVRLANDSEFGLSASVWTSDKKRGREIASRLEVGSVDINDASAHLACFPLPQVGWKQSGVGGRLGGAYGILKYCRPQSIVSNHVELSLISLLAWFPYSPGKARVVSALFRAIGARDLKRRLGIGGQR